MLYYGASFLSVAPCMTKRRFPDLAAWCVGVLLLLAGIYRLLTFVPQPLDSPATLRPHLYSWFAAFVRRFANSENAQQTWSLACFGLLLVAPALALLNYCSTSEPRARVRQILCSPTLLFAGIALALFACRLPALLADPWNPDEAQFIAAAHKLFVDPVYFRAVDCNTTGPFNIFPLMLPAVFGLSPDFASSRCISLLIMLASIYILYRTFRLLVDDPLARIAILPAAGAFAVLKNPDFVHYGSEDASFLLVSLAVFLCVKVLTRPGHYTACLFGLGLLTGTAFFAKMQEVPIVGAAALVAMARVYRSGGAAGWWRPAAVFLAGLAPVPAVNAILCLSTGVFNDFWMSYIVTNVFYAQIPPPLGVSHFIEFALGFQEIRLLIVALLALTIVNACLAVSRPQDGLSEYLRLTAIGGITALASNYFLRTSAGSTGYAYAGLLCVFVLAAALPWILRKKADDALPMRWFRWATASVVAASMFAVYAPHRLFQHYLLLLVIPLSVALSSSFLARSKSEPSGFPFVAFFVTLIVACQSVLHWVPDPVKFSSIRPEVRTPESDFIRAITQPSGQITVWGWNANPYLGSGRVAATRDLNMFGLFVGFPAVYRFYRDRFLRDVHRNPPAVIVDAVGVTSFGGLGGFFGNRNGSGFEAIPEINAYVQSHYVQVAEEYGQRFFVRRDLLDLSQVPGRLKQCEAGAIRCFDGTAGSATADLPPIRMPYHAVLDTVFTPETKPDPAATVFGNAGDSREPAGFQFQHIGDDWYRLAVGVGGQWAFSRKLLLPRKLQAALSFEFQGNAVTILYNGIKYAEMRLAGRMTDTPAPIAIGSTVRIFQIRDLGSATE